MSHESFLESTRMDTDVGQICETYPYFLWVIKDIDTLLTYVSPDLNIDGVKFQVTRDSSVTSSGHILLKPLVESSMSTPPSYTIKASISVVCGLLLEDVELLFTQKTVSTNLNIKDYEGHTIWKIEKEEWLYNYDKMIAPENGMNTVRFLCVFGPLSEYQEDTMTKDVWYKEKCFEKLGCDIIRLRPQADSPIAIKFGKDKIIGHKDILSVRSEFFLRAIHKNTEAEIVDMQHDVLDNIITYSHTGLLKGSYSDTLLKNLYNYACKYGMYPLREVVSFTFLERMNYCDFYCKCSLLDMNLKIKHVQQSLSEKEAPRDAHFVNKRLSPNDLGFQCLEQFSNIFFELFLLVQSYQDTEFKESLMFIVAVQNTFVLRTERWKVFCTEHSKLSDEMYDVYCKVKFE